MEYKLVREYSNHVEAEMAQGILEANGIHATILADDCGGMAAAQTFVRGVKVLVAEEEVERAKALLNL